MKKLFLLVILISFLWLQACNHAEDHSKNINQGELKANTYQNDEMGWSIDIPKGYTLIDLEKIEKMAKQGEAVIKKSYKQKIEKEVSKNLICFKKDDRNIFNTTIELYDEKRDGSWQKYTDRMYKVLYKTLRDNKINCDTTSGVELVDDLLFKTFSVAVLDSAGKVSVSQLIYNRLINGRIFTAQMMYSNDSTRDVMVAAWKKSKFRKM